MKKLLKVIAVQNATGKLNIATWIDEASVKAVAYSQYWNDEQIERGKTFYVLERGFENMEAYIRQTGLVDDLQYCLAKLREKGVILSGNGIDVAAGVLWMLPILFKAISIDQITCIEYSKHRLLKLGPEVIAHYGLPVDKITLALGSFYDIRLPAGSVDFAILCQALHHADDPVLLLKEIFKVLRPGGIVVVTGEHKPSWTIRYDFLHIVRYFAARLPRSLRLLILRNPDRRVVNFLPRSEEDFPPDRDLGDRLILPRDYRRYFAKAGFNLQFVKRPGSKTLSLLGFKPAR